MAKGYPFPLYCFAMVRKTGSRLRTPDLKQENPSSLIQKHELSVLRMFESGSVWLPIEFGGGMKR